MNKSEDESDELRTVGIGLSSQKSDEDEDNDVVGNVSWVFNDGIGDEENGSDILEAVWGKKESDSGGFNGITQNWFDLLVDSAFIEDILGLLDEGQKFSLGSEVLWVLSLIWIGTCLSFWICSWTCGLITSRDDSAHLSFWTRALTSSNDEANEATRRKAKTMATFIFFSLEIWIIIKSDRSCT